MSHTVIRDYDDPFIILHNEDLHALMQNVKPTSINVFLALMMRANRKSAKSCYPSLKTLAKEANVSRQTVVNAISELESFGVITVEHRMTEEGDATSNLYLIHRVPEEKLVKGGKEYRPHVGDNLHHGVGKNLDPNHMNTEPDEMEPYVLGESENVPQFSGKPKTKKPATIPDDWWPSNSTLDWYQKNGFPVQQFAWQAEQFKDHNAAKGNTYIDWDRAFMTWIRNAKDWGRLNGKANGNGRSHDKYDRSDVEAWAQENGVDTSQYGGLTIETKGRMQ